MAENKEGQEKTEPASGKRLKEARDRGQVSKSMEITTASVLLFGSLFVFALGVPMINNIQLFMKEMFHNSSAIEITTQNISGFYLRLILLLGKILLPVLGVVFGVILVAEISQVGFHFATKKFSEGLNFKSILNPFSGLKRIFFSGRSLFELLKSLMKLMIVGSVVYSVLNRYTEKVMTLIDKPYTEIGSFLATVGLELAIKVGAIYILIAIADYAYQKHKFKEDMKMTKQEVKEETKQTEGDPKIKGRIRSIMRQRFRKWMLQNVKKADVVITNPTHFAVALSYDPLTMHAPLLVAKGADYLALQIIQIAESMDVIIVQQPPLARALYYSVEIDREIPENLFKAVAQVLAYVYQLKNKKLIRA